MGLQGVKAVAFDAFSTLFSVPTMSPVEDAWLYLRQEHPELGKKKLGSAHARYENDFNCGQSDSIARWQSICEDALGVDATGPHHWGRLCVLELAACIENVTPFPGAYETLGALRADGVPTAIISNASYAGKALEQILELDNLVDHFLLSCDFGCTKDTNSAGDPSGALWLRLPELFELPAEQILVIDDGIQHVNHAHALGFKTALAVQGEAVERYERSDEQCHADVVLYDLLELFDHVPQLAA